MYGMIKGRIKTYQIERGFGFIRADNHAKDIFFHISDLPFNDKVPKIGEELEFKIIEENGKKRAYQIVRLELKQHISPSLSLDQRMVNPKIQIEENIRHTPQSRALANEAKKFENSKNITKGSGHSSSLFSSIIGIVLIFGLGYMVYGKYQDWANQHRVNKNHNIETDKAVQNFRCDGREHCSQMHSYEEALFFIQNCPNTKMDGDGDGIPCERQFGLH